MAIAEDASSPAAVTSTTTAVTTASFTPVANSLLVATVAVGNSTGSGIQTGSVTDSLSSTWTRLARENVTGEGCAEVWVLDAGASPAARTVTLTGTSAGSSLNVAVLTGAATVAGQTGAVVLATGTATSAAITTTTTGSYVCGALSHCESATSLTVNGSTTAYLLTSYGTNGETYATFKAAALTATPGSITLGMSTGALATYDIVLVEILPAASGSSSPSFGAARPGRTWQRRFKHRQFSFVRSAAAATLAGKEGYAV